MRWFKDLVVEWRARRNGAKFVSNELATSARAIIGPTGNMWSNGWQAFDDGRDAYMRSFDPRVPPSLHVSQHDATRANMPVPLVERCIEDWYATTGSPDEDPAASADQDA